MRRLDPVWPARCAGFPATAWVGILAVGLALACSFDSCRASPGDVLTAAEREQLFQSYFDRMTAVKPLTRFETRQEWFAYSKELRGNIARALGLFPMPERVPLAPVITGKLEREGYTVERVYYHVLPKVYASGYLYNPSPRQAGARSPAVLNPHGHWSLGALDPTVQARCIGLAKKGYVAFCPDSTHVADLGVGLCPIGLMTWNNIRALDYLESLDFVDGTRLGCTGESGGGQQTMYLAALDERVKVIVPAVLVSYFRRILFVSEQAHCFCNHAPGIARLTDETEMAAMFAPRPSLFICATGDWTRDFPKEEFPEIRRIFELTGGAVDCVQFDKPHNYDRDSREPMYAWMNKYLKGDTDPAHTKEPPIKTEPPEVLKALSGPVPGGSGLEGARSYYRSNFIFRPPLPEGKGQWREFQARARSVLGELLGQEFSTAKPLAIPRGTTEFAGLRFEKLLIATEPGVSVPAWLFVPENRRKRNPALIIVHPEGKQSLLSKHLEFVRDLVSVGNIVLAVDPRFRGELKRNWHWNEVIWGKPEEGLAAHDLNCAGTYLRSRKDVNPEKIFLAGFGEAGRFALCAAALKKQWAGIGIEDMGPLYADCDVLQVVPHLLRHGDLPEIAALAAPQPLWLNGARSRFGFTEASYRALGKVENVHCSDLSPDVFAKELPGWIAAR